MIKLQPVPEHASHIRRMIGKIREVAWGFDNEYKLSSASVFLHDEPALSSCVHWTYGCVALPWV